MKVRMKAGTFADLEIEGDPEEVAELLVCLNQESAAKPARDGNLTDIQAGARRAAQQVRSRAGTSASRRRPDPVAAQGSSPASRHRSESRAPIDRLVARPYGGSPNRREKILYCLEELSAAGQQAANLSAIRKAFAANFPAENQKNLDQVVRDLANKTDWVDSPSRGLYRLARAYRNKYFQP